MSCRAQHSVSQFAKVQAAKPSPYGTGEHKAASAQLVLALLVCQAPACCVQPAGEACAVSCSCSMCRAWPTTKPQHTNKSVLQAEACNACSSASSGL